MTNFTELRVTITPNNSDNCNILIAELSQLDFDTFMETEYGFCGYIPTELFNKQDVSELLDNYQHLCKIEYEYAEIEPKNWNLEWEREHFEPIVVGNDFLIRSSFHQTDLHAEHEIVIDPNMTFGTGTHETTYLMLQEMKKLDFAGKKVLDMGCGTGILAIAAIKLGANHVVAIDNYDWAYSNTIENCNINNTPQIISILGDVTAIPDADYDIILANITRNVLTEDIPEYAKRIVKDGYLMVSGFFDVDLELITNVCTRSGLAFVSSDERKQWTEGLFRKL